MTFLYTKFLRLFDRSTEDVFQALEDNQVKLSTMKASRFVKAFESDVDHWERTLSLILEVVEILLTVQRQWMYLEVREQQFGTSGIYLEIPLIWYCDETFNRIDEMTSREIYLVEAFLPT